MSKKIELLGNGVYSFSDAARLTRLKQIRLREWFRGRSGRRRSPVFHSDYDGLTEKNLISFMDLIEVFIAGQLREQGISLQTVRKAHAMLQKRLDVKHPFCRNELLTSGGKIFIGTIDQAGEQRLTEVLSGQRAFRVIIEPFLKSLDYDRVSRSALRWHIANQVVVDPAICFGQPIVQKIGVPTLTLARSYLANGKDAGIVARWFDVNTEDVLAAVDFETSRAA